MVGGGRPLLPEILGQPVPVGSQKRKMADFRKNRTSLEESLLQSFFCVKTVSDKVVRHSLA